MGFATGSLIAQEVVDSIKVFVEDEDARRSLYRDLISIFESYDCDTLDEVEDKEFIEEYKQLNPDEEDEDWYYEEDE